MQRETGTLRMPQMERILYLHGHILRIHMQAQDSRRIPGSISMQMVSCRQAGLKIAMEDGTSLIRFLTAHLEE